MSESYDASSALFSPSSAELSPLGRSNSTISPSLFDVPPQLFGPERREWLRAHGAMIIPGRCEYCTRRRPVIDPVFLERGNICTNCAYPQVDVYNPIIHCECICQCAADSCVPNLSMDPINVLEWRVARDDVADEEYDPDEHSSVSSDDTYSDLENPINDEMEEVTYLNPRLQPPPFYLLDLVAQGRYSQRHVLNAFPHETFDLFFPGVSERDADGMMRVHRQALPPAYNLQPQSCRYCELTISDHREACEVCTRPLTNRDETTSIGVGTTMLLGRECMCQCICDADADSYQSSNTSRRRPGGVPVSPDSRSTDDETYSYADPPTEEEHFQGPMSNEDLTGSAIGSHWNLARNLRVTRSRRVYGPIPHSPATAGGVEIIQWFGEDGEVIELYASDDEGSEFEFDI